MPLETLVRCPRRKVFMFNYASMSVECIAVTLYIVGSRRFTEPMFNEAIQLTGGTPYHRLPGILYHTLTSSLRERLQVLSIN
ncbi:hypothetical protein BKA82DRAFT_768922 [Pisolithus tinctorius]|uniref:Uncharacterized protein n=1 Tax=Pisolithus tinctorius Marx 270 TaxID=870435 RepID=A0A0C3NGY8_PISTI|nr:hypothetical protein BKA82DRAFT_768922 [Pisolithus tinctorius]KIO00310.1 hypothetical protein M404DRAFT_768922 [Pisolithus tinctorius Marx 270]